jgi:hypothetical protein
MIFHSESSDYKISRPFTTFDNVGNLLVTLFFTVSRTCGGGGDGQDRLRGEGGGRGRGVAMANLISD